MRSWRMLALVAALVVLGGCSQDGNEFQRLVCEVSSVNGGAPLVSGYVDIGQVDDPLDDTFPIDVIEVTFQARAYNDAVVLAEGSPYSHFHVTGYDIIWHPLSAAGDSLVNYNVYDARTDAIVPVDDHATAAVLIADRSLKDRPWFAELYTGVRPSFTAVAELRFRGHETGSETEIEIPAALTVTFVGALASD